MQIIDLHCDTITRCAELNNSLLTNELHIDLNKLQQGGALAQVFAIFVLTNEEASCMNLKESPYQYYERIYKYYQEQLEKNKQYLAPMYCYDDMIKNMSEGKISSLLSIEDGVVLGDSIERLYEVYKQGVRLITLTWNYENAIGFPNSLTEDVMCKGLKPFGKQVVEVMNELGMIIDVSHLSEGGFYDVASISKKPFIASHSCARALCNHQRNLTDHQLHTIGEHGGIVGMNFYSMFVNQQYPQVAYINDIVKHMKYIADKAGIDAVAFGSDYDGIDNQLEWNDYSGMNQILDVLSREFTSTDLEKITHKNASRIIKEVL